MTALDLEYIEAVERVALPYWASVGFDDHALLFAEKLSFDGDPISDIPHRAMVQARQIYVFADAAANDKSPSAGERALIAMDNLLKRYSEDGDLSRGIAFSIARNGAIISSKRDAYTHAFLLFALAATYRLTWDRAYLRAADSLNGFVELHLVDPGHFGLYSSAAAESDDKLQNPLMHLFEAYLSLHEVHPTGEYLEKARGIVRLFARKLYRAQERVLPEYFARDWTEHPDPRLGQFFEPGHHFEWVWLLSRYDQLAQADHSQIIDGLWETALGTGVSSEGLCYDAVSFAYSPLKKSTRLWPHTEGVKAAALRIGDDPAAAGVLNKMLAALNSVFLGKPFPGGWIDHLDPKLAPLVDYVPASSLYHLYLASSELSRASLRSERTTEAAFRG